MLSEKQTNNYSVYFVSKWNGKHDKIKRPGVCQALEAVDLKMVDIRSFLSALKIGWLKRILCDDEENNKGLTDYVSTGSKYQKTW